MKFESLEDANILVSSAYFIGVVNSRQLGPKNGALRDAIGDKLRSIDQTVNQTTLCSIEKVATKPFAFQTGDPIKLHLPKQNRVIDRGESFVNVKKHGVR